MDFFDQGTSFETIIETLNKEYEVLKKEYGKTFMKVMLFILAIVVTASVFIFLKTDTPALIIAPVLFGLMSYGISVLVLKEAIKGKILNKTLNKELIKLYNLNEGRTLDYQEKTKSKETFNKEMALFVNASVNVKYKIKTNHFKLINC